MIKYFCDRCGKELDRSYRAHISYSGNEEAYFCKECNEEFLNWMKNKPMVCAKCGCEAKNYDDRIKNYDDRILALTKALNLATDDRDWWRAQCNEFYKDYKVLSKKLDEIMTHGSVK